MSTTIIAKLDLDASGFVRGMNIAGQKGEAALHDIRKPIHIPAPNTSGFESGLGKLKGLIGATLGFGIAIAGIKKVIDVCRRKRVETSICGQAGSKKEMVEFLFRKGINSISVNADAAQEISQLIKSFEEEWKKRKEEFEKQTKKENDKTVNYKDFKLRNKKNKKHWKKWDKRGGIQNPEQKINSTQNQTQDKNKNKILSDIKIQAEFEDIKLAQDDKGIEPFNDLDRIEQKSEEINKKIQAEKEEDIKEMQKTEDNIILKEKRLHQIIPEETIKENKNEEMPQPAIKKVPDEKIMEEIDNVLAKTKDFPDSEDIFEETGILNSDDENNKK